MDLKFLETKRNLADVYMAGLVSIAKKFGAKDNDAKAAAEKAVLTDHPGWIDPMYLKEYRASALQARFSESPDKRNLLALRADVSKSEMAWDVANGQYNAISDNVKVDIAPLMCPVNVQNAKSYRAQLDAAIAKSLDGVKSAQDVKRAECAGLLASRTKAQNALRENMDTAGFSGYNLTPAGELVLIAPEHKTRVSTGGKRGASTTVTCDGSARTFDSLVAAMHELGVSVPVREDGSVKGIGYEAGAARIVKTLKAAGAKEVMVSRQ